MKKIRSYFISGLLCIIPIWLVFSLLVTLASLVTNWITISLWIAAPLVLLTITIVGYLTRRVFKRYVKKHVRLWAEGSGVWSLLFRAMSHLDELSEKTSEAFSNPVLYKVDDGIYKLGFITDHDMDVLGIHKETGTAASAIDKSHIVPDDAVWIYAPLPITMTGELLLVERTKITPLEQSHRHSIPLFILTAGLVEHSN